MFKVASLLFCAHLDHARFNAHLLPEAVLNFHIVFSSVSDLDKDDTFIEAEGSFCRDFM